jgi:hypothetical protein
LVTLPKPATDEERLNALIEKVIKAYGGEERLRNLKGFILRWKTVHLERDHQDDFHVFAQLPDRQRWEWTPSNGRQVISVHNGENSWRKVSGAETVEETREEKSVGGVAEAVNGCSPAAVLRLKDPAFKASWVGEIKLGERTAVCLELVRKDGREFSLCFAGWVKKVKLYWDKDSAILLKIESSIPALAERGITDRGITEILVEESRVVNGLPMAQKLTRKVDGRVKSKTEVLDFRIVDKLDDKLFEKPGTP